MFLLHCLNDRSLETFFVGFSKLSDNFVYLNNSQISKKEYLIINITFRRYPMEVHFVHWNKKYANVIEALGKSDGLAVLGFMFRITPNDNSLYATIVNSLKNIKDAGTERIQYFFFYLKYYF